MICWNPTGNKILVRVDPVEEKSRGGIIVVPKGEIGERANMQQMTGVIVAVGPLAWKDQGFKDVEGNWCEAPWAKVGDRVKFTKFAGYLHREDSEPEVDYRVMHDLDVVMVHTGDNHE